MVFKLPRAFSAIQARRTSTTALSSLAFLVVLLSPTSAIQVTPDSACASICIDSSASDASDPNASNTYGSDIVCRDSDYSNSPVGSKFESCLNCLQGSSASGPNENDQGWYFYNLRFAFNSCIFGTTNASDTISTPCSTSSACGPIQNALGDGMGTPLTTSQYSYCTAYDNSFLGARLDVCRDCLKLNSDASYLSNFLTALQAGCTQRPSGGMVVGLNSTVFTKNQVTITFPQEPGGTKKHGGLSNGTIIGISIGCAVLLLLLIAIAFICVRRRRTVRRLKQLQSPLDERFGAGNITAPHSGAYSSPQTSPPLKEESVQMSRAPKVRNFSILRQLPQRAGEWQGTTLHKSPPETQSSNPPQYSPPRPHRDSLPAHHAYIPPEYTPPSRNSTSPLYFPPPPSPPQQPPQPVPASYPQRMSPPATYSLDTTVRNTLPSGPRASIARNTSNISNNLPSGPGASVARNPSNASVSLPSPPGPLPPATSHSRHPSTASRLQTQNLGLRRGFIPSPVQISGPIVAAGSRFETEEQAKKNRERLYREGLGGTLAHGPESKSAVERVSPESDTSEELWPGSY